ncbi:L-lactate dehydrogenase [Candidatus Babeliales bacterium]|nr:L-lactate dehydrogenase [Candidatus Babeliales bacterium]
MRHSAVAIIGAGSVGTTTAYALIMRNLVPHIMLVDKNNKKCIGEVLDLTDALPFSVASRIHAVTIKEAREADIIIIAAGARQEPGQDRADLVKTNRTIVCSIMQDLKPLKTDTIIIVVTNPVDIMTRVVQASSGLPITQVFGSGTLLDTQRLRSLLTKQLHIAEQSLHVNILGEHGDAQFVAWSSASVAGVPLVKFAGLSRTQCAKLEDTVRQEVYRIIECKGATFFGVGTCVAVLCETILFDQKRVLPVSCYLEDLDVALNMPAVLGRRGIQQIIKTPLNNEEQKKLETAAEKLKSLYKMHCQ